MKKLFTPCLALLMAALLIVPAMAAETAGSAVQEAAEVIGEAAEDAADTAETAADAVESAAEDAVDAVEDAAEEAADTVEEAAGKSSASSIFAKLLEQKWYTLAIVAALFVAQLQDWLNLGKEARINTPGTAAGNWQWRLTPGQADEKTAEKIAYRCGMYGRSEKEWQA